MRRPEAAGDENEVGRERAAEGALEVRNSVADDLDTRGIEPEPNELRGQERPVAVEALAADELRARGDDRRAGAALVVARVTLCAVTTKVVPVGSCARLPFTRTTTLSGSASASCNARPWKDFRCPCSSVPL